MDPITNEQLMQQMMAMIARQQEMLEKMQANQNGLNLKLEGVKMPVYSGRVEESAQLYYEQMDQYFAGKGIAWKSPELAPRILATLGGSLRGAAAQWFAINRRSIQEVDEFFVELHREFVPADLQQRLRDKLNNLQQRNCRDLSDYITRHRQLMVQIRDMSEIDRVIYFQRGLQQRTREEVQYRRCDTLSEAINVALDYDRAHHWNQRRNEGQRTRYSRNPFQQQNEPEPMEIDNIQNISKEECKRKKLCFKCKKPGHSWKQCRAQSRGEQKNNNRRPVNNVEEAEVSDDDVILFDRVTTCVLEKVPEKEDTELIRKQAEINGMDVNVLVDSGSSVNLIRPRIATKVLGTRHVQLETFDGNSHKEEVQKVQADVLMDGYLFKDQVFTEWKNMGDKHDVILGKPWHYEFEPSVNWRTNEITFSHCKEKIETNTVMDTDTDGPTFVENMKNGKFEEVYKVKICTVDNKPIPSFIQPVLKEFADVFPDKLPDKLPPERAVNFEMHMKENAEPKSKGMYRLSKTEQDALGDFIQENLRKGWIEVSNSPWVSNIFGVPKKDPVTNTFPKRSDWLRSGNSKIPIRWVIDYRHVNSQTCVPQIPLPLIEELFDKMEGCLIYSVIDLAQGYHQMLVINGSRQYTAFRTDKETYQWCVAPMGLAGMPGIWSRLMRSLFDKFDFVVVYLDDICIFSKSESAHIEHLRQVCGVLREQRLYAHRDKCSFGLTSVDFLGHTISVEGLSVDKKKTLAIERLSPPKSKKDLLSFLGLAGYYRRFICDFATHALPLSKLTKKDIEWNWGIEQDKAFLNLKLALQQAPVLKLPDFNKKFLVTTDASGYCVGAVLSQHLGTDDHPIAFYSKKLGLHEINWPAHEKELLAIKLALEKWRHYLHGRPFDVYTDNSACRWMLHHPKVSPKLARFLTFFSQFDFVLHHVRGVQNVVADALSRPVESNKESDSLSMVHECDNVCFQIGEASARHFRKALGLRGLHETVAHTILDDVDLQGEGHFIGVRQFHWKFEQVHNVEYTLVSTHLNAKTKEEFQSGYSKDPVFSSVWNGSEDSKFVKLKGLLYLQTEHNVKRLCVPNDEKLRTAVISEQHDGPVAAHPGIQRSQFKVAQWYYWPTLEKDVREYVSSCETCMRWKSSSLKKIGKLMPIPIPNECWEVVSMDFVVGLPASNGFDAILTVVDKLSKRAKYIPTHTTADAEDVARSFFDGVVRHHGLPQVIISDRDPKFTSTFWKSLMNQMGVKLSMTTAHRAQSDGQTERQNLVLEDALRCMVSYHGNDWANHLSTIEYAHATLVSSSTKLSPFTIDTGRQPRSITQSEFSSSTEDIPLVEYAQRFVNERKKLVELARKNLLAAQERQKQYYDKKRREVKFVEGDLVLLSTKNLSLRIAADGAKDKKNKLAAKRIGPFRISKMLSENVARLELPEKLSRLHPTFNVELLTHYVENPTKFKTRPTSKSAPIIVDEEAGEKYVVEKLLEFRQVRRKREWLVKWQSYPEHESTWEPEKEIKHVSHWLRLVEEYENRQREVKSGGVS